MRKTFTPEDALKDLENSWYGLQNAVDELPESNIKNMLLEHIDSAMCWDSVRNFSKMKTHLNQIQEVINKNEYGVSSAVDVWAANVKHIFENEVLLWKTL